MREDGLVARVPGRRRYSSYEGEVTPAPDNLVNRDFTAERPNEKWLTAVSYTHLNKDTGVQQNVTTPPRTQPRKAP